MDLLILLTYGALCFVVFRVFKLPVNEYSIVTAAFGGVVLLAGIMLTVNFNHPFTNLARTYFVSTPIVPAVRGRVIEVPVVANTPLKKGDVLFRIDPEPFETTVAQLKATKALVEAQILQDRERLVAAEAQLHQAEADRSLAQKQYDDDKILVDKGTIPANRLDQSSTRLETTISEAQQTDAVVEQARAVLGAVSADGTPAKLAEIDARLDNALWKLDQTVVRAPADGYVTQLLLTPGIYVVPLPLVPSMVFIAHQERILAAAFRQISVQRIKPGYEVEVAFHALPGTIIRGKVLRVLPAMAAGQASPSGTLIAPELQKYPGRVVVLIELSEAVEEYRLPGGSMGAVAVYSEQWQAVAIVRKVLLRVKAWTYYLAFEH